MADMDDDQLVSLGERLREFRTRRGLSLRQVAKRAGINSGYLSQLERGAVAHPAPPTLRRLGNGYGLPTALVAEWAGYRESDALDLSANQAAALALLGDPTDAELRAISAMIEALRSNSEGRA